MLLLLDGSKSIDSEEISSYKEIEKKYRYEKSFIWVLNKHDIKLADDTEIISENPIWISCKNQDGIEELINKITATTNAKHDSEASSITITSIRHKDALAKALKSLGAARISLENGLSADFAAVDLRATLNFLGEIIGLTTPDDILNNIFSNFCIGK